MLQLVKIIKRIGFDRYIDGSCTSDEVSSGRPYPYMINNLIEKFNLTSASEVVKVGDTVADIKEGKNAKTKYTISVLTGADNKEKLKKYCLIVLYWLSTDKRILWFQKS